MAKMQIIIIYVVLVILDFNINNFLLEAIYLIAILEGLKWFNESYLTLNPFESDFFFSILRAKLPLC